MNKSKIFVVLIVLCFGLTACTQGDRTDPHDDSSRPESRQMSENSDAIDSLEENDLLSADKGFQSLAENPGPISMDTEIERDSSASPSLSSREPEPDQSVTKEPQSSKAVEQSTSLETLPQTQNIPLAGEATGPSQAIDRIEQELLRLINAERTQNRLEALGVEETMQFAARIRAQEALTSLSHTRPIGSPYYTAFEETGFDYAGKWHGENLAVINVDYAALSETAVAEALFNEWLASPGHHQNILSQHFYQTGIGVHVEYHETMATIGSAQLFASL